MGCSLEDVQRASGHREPSTTKLYDHRGYNLELYFLFDGRTRTLEQLKSGTQLAHNQLQ
jgi:hypothetical protein